MNMVRGQRWRVTPPKTISVNTYKAIVESLNEFMPGLDTNKRSLRGQAIGEGQFRNIEGSDCWKVYQPFVFDKIEHLQIELTLHKNEESSCELHMEFRKDRIFLSVSDIGTNWRDAVFEEMQRKLTTFGIFKGEWLNKLTSTVIRLQNIFLIGGSYLLVAPPNYQINFKYIALSLLFTGLVPIISDIYRLYFPQKPITVLEEKMPFPIIKIEKSAMWIGIASGVVTLAKELVTILFR